MRNQLRLCPSDEAENQHLELLIKAAVSHASQYLDRPIPWTNKDGETVPVPEDVQLAILLIIGDLYENREGQFVGIAVSENQTVQNLLHFHRVGLGV
ncbi:MAG: phage gp6-like head-tail connector protein [Gammaproteobacteria bacterium]|nr:phage gp6-like head-tail connector protein [Gammaproteobacteria bacterium]